MTGGIDKVEYISFALIYVLHLYSVAFDSDAALALQVHIVEQLVLFFAFGYGLGKVEKAVSKGTLAVVDMCNNAEITDVFHRVLRFRY